MRCAWSPRDALLFWDASFDAEEERNKPKNMREREIFTQQNRPGDTIIHIKENKIHGIKRKMFCEGHGVFVSLQRKLNSADGLQKRSELLRASHHYRAILHSQVEQLKQHILQGEDKTREGLADLNEERKLLSVAELTWHFCEIFLISSQLNSLITPHIVEWVQQHLEVLTEDDDEWKTLEDTFEDIINSRKPETNPNYWFLIYRFVVRGQNKEAQELLKSSSEYRASQQSAKRKQTSPWFYADVLLDKMPQLVQGQSMSSFTPVWKQWQKECSYIYNGAIGNTAGHFKTLFAILCGEEDVIAQYTNNWFELLAAHLLFCDPTVKNFDLRYLVERCVEQFPKSDADLDKILQDFVNFDVYKAIGGCYKSFDPWFVAHLVDLLQHSGHIDPMFNWVTSPREYYIIQYCMELVPYPSLWNILIDYLSHCPQFGPSLMSIIVERHQIQSEKKAHKLLNVCKKYNLVELRNTIQRVVAMQKFTEKRYGSSVSWMQKSNHLPHLRMLANHLLDLKLGPQRSDKEDEEIEDLKSIADSLKYVSSDDFVFADSLAFLNCYKNLKIYLKEGDYRAVAQTTVELLTKQLAPKKYWVTLLYEILIEKSLIEAVPIAFDMEETAQLLACVEEISPAFRSKRSVELSEQDEERMEQLRLGLSRNYARCIVSPPSS